jgi:dTMP kinase
MNKLITFEGIEGSGKSTQMRLAAQHLIEKNVPLTITQEPSGTDIGRKIGGILFNRGHYYMSAETELFLFCAARAQHVREVVMPALQQERFVLCDRFSDATFAYQGTGRGLDLEFIRMINDYSSMQLKPTLTLLFDLPVESGLQRALERDNRLKDSSFSDRFEKENLDFHRRVREGYLRLCTEEPGRFRLIDATRNIDTIQEDVLRHIVQFIDGHN